MHYADLGHIKLHYSDTGNPNGLPLVFANSLGTDLRLWASILPLLPKSLRIIRYDKRGHGLSECPRPPYSVGALVCEVESLLDHLKVKECVFGGIESLAGGVMERWFSKKFRDTKELDLWRNMLIRQPDHGYMGCSAAISGTDFFTPTSGLRLPTLGIAGSEDGSTPPDLVRETVDLIPGSKFHLIRGAGHLPCVEKPDEYAKVVIEFLTDIDHV